MGHFCTIKSCDIYYKTEYNIIQLNREGLPVTEFEINKAIVLTDYNGDGGDVVIPAEVTEIGERAFYEKNFFPFLCRRV